MIAHSNLLTRSEKILLVMYELSDGKTAKIRYEDIVVRAFKKFSSDFQLKGYPEYPDTGDIVHKPLYSDLKKKGFVLSGGKYFALTKKGLEYGSILKNKMRGTIETKMKDNKFSRSDKDELENIITSNAYKMFIDDKKDEILDIDFHSYLGTTVRTKKYDFLGRLTTIEEAINATKQKNPKLYSNLMELHDFMCIRFSNIIDFFKNQKGGKI